MPFFANGIRNDVGRIRICIISVDPHNFVISLCNFIIIIQVLVGCAVFIRTLLILAHKRPVFLLYEFPIRAFRKAQYLIWIFLFAQWQAPPVPIKPDFPGAALSFPSGRRPLYLKQYTPFAPVFQVVRKSKGFAAPLIPVRPSGSADGGPFSVCVHRIFADRKDIFHDVGGYR